MSGDPARTKTRHDDRPINADKIQPGRLDARVPPGNLPDLERPATKCVGELTRKRKTAPAPKRRVRRVLEHAPMTPHRGNGRRPSHGILMLRKEAQPAPRATRRMRDDRQRPEVPPRVPLLVPPLGNEPRIRPAWVNVERRHVVTE